MCERLNPFKRPLVTRATELFEANGPLAGSKGPEIWLEVPL